MWCLSNSAPLSKNKLPLPALSWFNFHSSQSVKAHLSCVTFLILHLSLPLQTCSHTFPVSSFPHCSIAWANCELTLRLAVSVPSSALTSGVMTSTPGGRPVWKVCWSPWSSSSSCWWKGRNTSLSFAFVLTAIDSKHLLFFSMWHKAECKCVCEQEALLQTYSAEHLILGAARHTLPYSSLQSSSFLVCDWLNSKRNTLEKGLLLLPWLQLLV